MNTEPCERSIRQIREHLADVINDAVQGRITYVTSRGRRVAAVVPLAEISRPDGMSRETSQVTP